MLPTAVCRNFVLFIFLRIVFSQILIFQIPKIVP